MANESNFSKTVVLGMSGGVDSSVAALLLKQQGYHVIGMFMKNWEEKDENGICKASKEYEDVIKVCQQLAIPYYTVNFVKEYKERVFTQFLAELAQGFTPNPDILCNREIKFKVLYEKALELGADYLATGHYCQIGTADEKLTLLKGQDGSKDQSYFLYPMTSSILNHVLFPIGHLLKKEVREIAMQHQLATAEKKDSTGICFIGERNFKNFLSQYLAITPGDFKNLAGETVGQHSGVAYYTIGQRKGLGIGGAGEAWFVVGKDKSQNIVWVEQGATHPALYCDELIATEIHWIKGSAPSLPLTCQSKIRYRQPDQRCKVEQLEEGRVRVLFAIPQRAVTLRQAIVFYQDNCCLGGGIIESAGPSYYARQLCLPQEISP